MSQSVRPALAAALACPDVEEKLRLTEALAADWQAGRLVAPAVDEPNITLVCGIPERPALVHPAKVPQRSPATPEGRASLLHAIVHIEFSAINLGLDHAARFPEQSADYIGDWIGVALEEVVHFRLLRDRLRELGYDYGDFPAHWGLWQMAERTAHDPLARMALIPRLLEARGLDVTPPIQAKLEGAGDVKTARLLDIILRDEIGHVALGDKWFRHFCRLRGCEPEATYLELLHIHKAPRQPQPMNVEARRAAGFSEKELAALLAS